MDKQLHGFEEKVQGLADGELVEQVRKLIHREKQIGDAILLGLKEIKCRRIFAAMGYSSLFEMLVKYYHLSETASYQRVNALKLIDAVPEAQETLLSGKISLSNAALVQSFIQRSEKEAQSPMSIEEKITIIESIKGKTHKEAQIALAEINPIAALPTNKEKPLSKNHTQLQIVVDQETITLLKEVQEHLSHTIPDGDYNAVLKYMGVHVTESLRKKKGRTSPVSKLIDKSDADLNQSLKMNLKTNLKAHLKTKMTQTEKLESNVNSNSNSRTNSTSNGGENFRLNFAQCTDASKRRVRSRYISQETRRIVFSRAEGKCEYLGVNGRRCGSRHQLEIDHSVPFSQGGGNDDSNCRLLCKVHNLYRVKDTHGFWYGNAGKK